MNHKYEHRNLHWRKLDSLLRLTSLHDWRKYEIHASSHTSNCTWIKISERLKIYLYNEVSAWRIKWHYETAPKEVDGSVYISIDEGNRLSSKSSAAIMFLYSVFSNLNSRNTIEFSEREHDLYRWLGNMFYLRNEEYKYIIADWKANAHN